jgi:cyclopropane fatty-acyl-phospholipid synthase-like methyltransferase
MDFYDAISSHYREVVNEAGREQDVQRFADELAARVDGGRALDLACGAGLYSIALARADMDVVGVDLSERLLEIAEGQARRAGISAEFVLAPMQALPETAAGPFDLAVCMGNSVPHLLGEADLAAFFGGVAWRLASGGWLAVHQLNYDRVLGNAQRIVGITRSEDGLREYVRFYDFLDQTLRFNVLEIDHADEQISHTLNSTTLRPWRAQNLIDGMEQAGFTDIEAFGGLDMSEFNLAASDTVLLLARRP